MVEGKEGYSKQQKSRSKLKCLSFEVNSCEKYMICDFENLN